MSLLHLEVLEDRCLLSYTITDLGTLGGATSAAYALNAAGDAVGEADLPTGQYGDAFLYSSGTMTDLGKITTRGSVAYGVNSADQVVGVSYDIGDHAFLWQDGVMSNLGTLGGSESAALAINDAGQIVGNAKTAQVQYHAFLYQDGVMSDLGTLGGTYSSAYSINASGQAAGDSTLANSANHHAFFYDGSVMNDLGTLGGASSYANSLNDAGQVAGWSNFTGGGTYDAHAFLFSDGVMNDLGTLPGATSSDAYGINNAGQVVGESYPVGTDYFHAFLYSDGVMTDLNDLLPTDTGWVLRSASAINDAGQIVGSGTNPDGQSHAFLLSPDNGGPAVDSVPVFSAMAPSLVAPIPLENVQFLRIESTNSMQPQTADSSPGLVQGTAGNIASLPMAGGQHVPGLVFADGLSLTELSDALGKELV